MITRLERGFDSREVTEQRMQKARKHTGPVSSGFFQRQWHLALLTALLIVLSACQTSVVTFGEPMVGDPNEPAFVQRYGSVVAGILAISSPQRHSCDNTPRRVVITRDWIDMAIHFWIGGLYTTRSVKLYCASPNWPTNPPRDNRR